METVELLSPEEHQALEKFQKADEHLGVLSLIQAAVGAALVIIGLPSMALIPMVRKAITGSDHLVSVMLWSVIGALFIGWIIGWFMLRPRCLRGMAERNAARSDPLYRQARRKLAEIDKKLAPMKKYLSDDE